MNREQREYTLLQIKKYNKEAEKYDKKAKKDRWFAYVGLALFVACLGLSEEVRFSQVAYVITNILQYAGLFAGVENLRQMFGNMAIKAGFENMIENSRDELVKDELADKKDSNDKGLKLIP